MAYVQNGIQYIKRYTKLPITLYRIQASLPVSLRNYETQQEMGRESFDVKLHVDDESYDKLKKVFPAVGDEWIGPNGMSLRPGNETMLNVIKAWRGPATVYRMSDGLLLPSTLCVLHERDDHYSLQTTEKITLDQLNERMTEFLLSLPSQTKEQFIAQMEDYDDQDN